MPEPIHLPINEPPSILVAQFLKALKQIEIQPEWTARLGGPLIAIRPR